MSQELPIILAFYDLSVLLLQRVIAFPKNPRYGLGRSIEHRTETILALLIQAKYALRRDKDPFLRDVNVELEILRFQIRQATDLRAISMNQQHAIIEKLIVVGQHVGGWRKSVGGDQVSDERKP